MQTAEHSLSTLNCESAVFISDLHLSDQTPALIAKFEQFCRSITSQWLIVMGDLFEGYCGDDDRSAYINAVEHTFVALHRRGVRVALMHGNRDFLMAADFVQRSHAVLLSAPCVFNGSILLSHGDGWCIHDTGYQAFRTTSRESTWQALFLTQPLALRQAKIQAYRAQSKSAQIDINNTDTDVVDEVVCQAAQQFGCTTVLHGHTHRPSDRLISSLGHAIRKCVLSDWEVNQSVVTAEFSDGQLRLHTIEW